jgi:shikimate 5-dehydrogenase
VSGDTCAPPLALLTMANRMYFLGVSTGASSIQRIFPAWTRLAGVPDAVLTGLDIALGAPPHAYHDAAGRMKDDPDCRGALVTTHKVSLYRHAGDLFDGFDDDARLLGEVSCVVCRGGRLHGQAIDTLTGELSLRALLRGKQFTGEALIMGAGGAGLALAMVLRRHHRPARVILTDISSNRLHEIAGLADAERVAVKAPSDHDRLIAALAPGCLILNATGLGKDRPGSPVTAGVQFPPGAIAWDLNYRGDLTLLDHARKAGVRAVDGWEYFLHGWSQIMGRVLGFEVTPELLGDMRTVAAQTR